MKSGLYHCFMERSCGFDIQDITVLVKCTPKRYTFTLIEDRSRFKDGHIEQLFKNGKKVNISRDKTSCHALKDWGDNSFTIYPFRNGVPFYFVYIRG